MHIFKYSVREGTLAAKMEQIPESIKEERSKKMLALAENMKREFYDSFKGRVLEVLAEQKTADGTYHATAPNYMEVFVESDEDITGRIVEHTV